MIRVLIVDDEAPARRKIRAMLAREPDIVVAGEAADGLEAVDRIRMTTPDVVFLDIQMPQLDGFGVIDEIGVDSMPLVVFVTAYDEYALRAFEVEAIDYITKPFAPTRFRAVLGRVRQRVGRGPDHDLPARIERLLASITPGPRYLRRILVDKGHERRALLPVEAIDRFRADRNEVRIFTRDGEFTRRSTLSSIEPRLDPDRFRRISRSDIIRLDAIKELQPWFHGDHRVIMKDGTMLTWGRRFRSKMKDLL